jgi:F0F1-type ATP synthase delta subunit
MEGRYATALFSTASKAGQLDVVYEEISAFQLLYREVFK